MNENTSISCACFVDIFSGFYSPSFLRNAQFVIVDSIPKPDFPELQQLGLGRFMELDARGITYKNTYYVLRGSEDILRLHFHELVHVAQWQSLGAAGFITRYIQEIQQFGYDESPLEIMAYSLDAHFSSTGKQFDIPDYVAQHL
ncbi:hypothetical protein [Microbulbifer aggregans]|uniref:hypothetical protein n=1 Tax=Microbulbifer aggregans TaxID=1769779 RepID=UPI001CFCB3A2|nr:hypothetical protein [Microbulbifer aggregans]